MKRITIFTPTYNRAYCLHRCYESLLRQTCLDFEWLIIDDGSSDNTYELVQSWIKKNPPFTIRYIYKKNGGMHTGYNVAYQNIETELCMNIDSDDYLTDTAVQDVLRFWNENRREGVGGIYALDQYEDGKIVGLPFPDDLKEFHGWGYKIILYEVEGKKKQYVNHGDKKFIGITSVIKKYPSIPVFEGEKYHSLYYKQHLIERDYTILVMNKPVCVVEYLADGSSKNMYTQYIKNPKGFCSERKFVMKNAPILRLRFEAAIHYVAESMIAGNRKFVHDSSNRAITLAAILPGSLLYFIIKRKTRKCE